MSSTSSQRLVLRTLGTAALVRVADDGTEETLLEVSKVLSLITYLAAAPGRAATREQLIDLLWSDLEPEAGKHAVRQQLWQIRRRFGDELVIEGRDTLTLRTHIPSDRDELLDAAQRGDLTHVVELHRGDFFPGFAAPGSGELERWVEEERSRLRTIFLRSGELLVRQWLSEARARDGQALARRLRNADPMRQQGWRLLLEALVAAHDPIAAAVEADAFERHLHNEDIEAEPASTALIKLARRLPSETAAAATDTRANLAVELVGREREFAALMRAWDDARRGRGVVVAMSAPPGFGKTRLLHEMEARLQSMRARTVRVRAEAGARGIAHALTSDLAAALAALPGARGISPASARTLVALNPSLSSIYSTTPTPVSGDDHTAARLAALRELIVAVSEERPVAVLVDDLHWADAESRQLLAAACGGFERHPVLVVTATRPTSAVFAPAATARPLPLAPLGADSIATLIASLATLPPEPWANTLADDLARATGGSPLHLLETLQLLGDAGTLTPMDGTWTCADSDTLAASLREGGPTRRRIAALGADARAVLEVLAVAGWPLSVSRMEAVMNRAEPRITESLLELEQAGLAARRGDGWAVAHDEFADASVDAMPAPDRARIHAALGRALVAAGHDRYAMRRAASHLSRGDEPGLLANLYARFVTRARRERDRRTHVALAADLLGLDADDAEAVRLASTLPLRVRLGLVTWPRVAAAVSLVLLATTLTAAAATRRHAAPPDAVLLVIGQSRPHRLTMVRIPVRDSGWGTSPIEVSPAHDRRTELAISATATELLQAPGRSDLVVFSQPVSDSGVTDLFVAERGVIRRLTSSPADDVHPSWSPDGRFLVFRTGRWNELRHDDLAIMDLATGSTRQLTSGDPTDWTPRWSPDGTRVAFLRNYWTRRPSEICTIAVSGEDETCRAIAAERTSILAGWAGDSHLLVVAYRDGQPVLLRHDLVSGTSELVEREVDLASVSPDGRWMAVRCVDAGRLTWWLASTMQPARRRELRIDSSRVERVSLAWGVSSSKLAYLDSTWIDAGPASPVAGVPHQLRAHGLNHDGTPASPRMLRWSTDDASIATVDSLGVLHPRQAGPVVVEVSAGGWRVARRRLDVRTPVVTTLRVEEWNELSRARWRTFGEPSPEVVTTSTGRRALHNAGDGTYWSGIYSGDEYLPSESIGIDAELSTPVSLEQWQSQHGEFLFGADSASLARWDHRTGFFPQDATPGSAMCGFGYPAGAEGPDLAETASSGGGAVEGARSLGTGAWYRIRLQLLPDGRCAVALNGRAIGISAPHAGDSSRLRVALYGQSFRTRMLVGRLELFRGVKTDVDWATLDTASVIDPPVWQRGARRVASLSAFR